MSITAYDGSIELPSQTSKLITVHPSTSPWSIQVHLACSDPPSLQSPNSSELHNSHINKGKSDFPTILYESASGIPGSIALLPLPLLPTTTENATNPGRWLFDLQAKGQVGRICVWDRPGYGFSENAVGSNIGTTVDVLWEALKQAGEVDKATEGFTLVGEGFGG